MSIIKNAIDSIQIGIEDYTDDDERRNVSAVRNIFAGILLLYKEKLCQLSPPSDKELLIKQDIRPFQNSHGNIEFKGSGRKTVDVQSIKERFKDLGINVDWKRFDEINSLRNDLEHYYTVKAPSTVREVIAKSFLLIRDFFTEHLNIDPQDSLGDEVWATLLEVNEVYSAEEKLCKESIDATNWKYLSIKEATKHLSCKKCHSSLIQVPYTDDSYPQIYLHCKSCNYDFCFEDVIEQCVADSLLGDAYIAATDGGEPPYDLCPECDQYTFIHQEECCVACDYKMEYKKCGVCDSPLNLDEQDNEGKCGYCQYRYEKTMSE